MNHESKQKEGSVGTSLGRECQQEVAREQQTSTCLNLQVKRSHFEIVGYPYVTAKLATGLGTIVMVWALIVTVVVVPLYWKF